MLLSRSLIRNRTRAAQVGFKPMNMLAIRPFSNRIDGGKGEVQRAQDYERGL